MKKRIVQGRFELNMARSMGKVNLSHLWLLGLIFLVFLRIQVLGQGPEYGDLIGKTRQVIQGVEDGTVRVQLSKADGPSPPDPSIYGALERGMAATVVVVVQKVREYKHFYFGSRGGGPTTEVYHKAREMCRGRLSGSGFVVKDNGIPCVVTNLHLVEQAADSLGSIVVVDLDGEVHPMRLLCGDALYDFAVLGFVGDDGIEDSISFRKGKASQPRIGEPVYAIGNPLGEYPWTTVNGIVSGVNRNLGSVTGRFPFIQTTVPIHTGNSGGPLIDSRGEVVGMMSQIAMYPDRTPMAQTSFALDARTCARLTHDIMTLGTVKRCWFGIQLEAVKGPMEQWTGVQLPCAPVLGEVFASARSRAQLDHHIGWSLVQVGKHEVRSLDMALEALEALDPAKQVAFVFVHSNGKRDTVIVEAEVMKPTHLVEIANMALLPPPFINANLEPDDPVLVNVDGARWGQSGKQLVCYVLAAGVLRAETPFWYETMKPEELGAAIQLLGPEGMIDLLVVPEHQRSDTGAVRSLQVPLGAATDKGGSASLLFH